MLSFVVASGCLLLFDVVVCCLLLLPIVDVLLLLCVVCCALFCCFVGVVVWLPLDGVVLFCSLLTVTVAACSLSIGVGFIGWVSLLLVGCCLHLLVLMLVAGCHCCSSLAFVIRCCC